MRTAKDAFLQSAAKEPFSKVAESAVFDTACEYALLAFVETLPPTMDPNAGWTQAAMVSGARGVLAMLRTLHMPEDQPKESRMPRLKPPQ